jgi:hypothetical protein
VGTIIGVIAAVIIGAGIAAAAAVGVVSSQTHAPSANPANVSVVQYGNK